MNSGAIKTKLIAAKERWAREGRLLTGKPSRREEDRLPPGQRKVTDWPVLDLGVKPNIPLAQWRLSIDGLVEQSMRLDWDAFQALPQSDLMSDIHCVTAWSRFDNRWRGVAVMDLLERVQPKPEANFVVLHSFDTYTTNLPLEEFAMEGALLATHWEGKALTIDHGGPVRAIVPQLYFWKSAKWLKRIEFIAADRPGFWEERGYHNFGDPWREQRYG
ncbi:MAG TPA: sulfite oxidase-like oxidoreductase [Candidatus Binatia bacterium]|nr:sulfite oxidase-like oxidoreductase [Candidatus Binatia bacterium]